MNVYFKIETSGKSQSGKTDIFTVRSSTGPVLGEIKWFAAWRKYCFFPLSGTVFDELCMKELGRELDERTEVKQKRMRGEKNET